MNQPFSSRPPSSSQPGEYRRPARKRNGRSFAVPLSEALAASDAFSALRDGVVRLRALETDLADCLPDYLRHNVTAAGTVNDTLTLLTPHSALAARLRHLETRLIQSLCDRGWRITAIKVRIRPHEPVPAAQAKTARLSQTGLHCLQALEDSLEPSPLRDAIARMVSRHGG